MEDVISAISQVGFPIVCTLILAYVIYDMNTRYDKMMQDFIKTIDANTKAISELSIYIKDGASKNE